MLPKVQNLVLWVLDKKTSIFIEKETFQNILRFMAVHGIHRVFAEEPEG